MGRFRIGDRVVFTERRDPDEGVYYNMTGTVCNLPYDYEEYEEDDYISIGVSWDGKDNGHDCNGSLNDRSGWMVPQYMLCLLCDPLVMEQDDVDCLIKMIVA